MNLKEIDSRIWGHADIIAIPILIFSILFLFVLALLFGAVVFSLVFIGAYLFWLGFFLLSFKKDFQKIIKYEKKHKKVKK